MTAAKIQATKTLVLLDVHAILHRAYHALPDFTTKDGTPTGGLYGLTAMLIKIITDLKPDYLAACYDLPAPTFRKVVYEQYKAGRRPTDSALVSQIENSRELFRVLGIPCYDRAGFEADDIIGTIVEWSKQQPQLKVIIASGDLDTLQLVDGVRVVVYTLKKGLNDTIIYAEKAVCARFGFVPTLLPDWKGLRGDPSDNIIGIAGIGEKTATELIVRFGTIEQIYRQLKRNLPAVQKAGIKERVIKLLLAGEEEALFSKTLATIRRDAPIDFRLPDKLWREQIDVSAVETLFRAWEFRTLKERFKNLFQAKIEIANSSSSETISPEIKIAAWLLGGEEATPDLAKLKAAGLEQVYNEIELPLIPILAIASARGILLDLPYLKKLSTNTHRELRELENKIYAAVGGEFNLNSPKQLGQVLFERLHLSVKGLRKTPGGARSTRESELRKLATAHPAVADILTYREHHKLLSTYIDALPKLTDAHGILHTTFDQTGTTTGRLSSRDPNLQNIPTAQGLGLAVRRAFIARPGCQFVALDYAQIEMRVLAALSGDEALLQLFRDDLDIHRAVAARVFGVEEGEVTKEMRREAKIINFGIVYGMGINSLQASLQTSRAAAEEFYQRYFAAFPKIRYYFDEVKILARKNGYTTTDFGRRRYLPLLRSPLPRVRAEAERMAMNAPVQGTAADIIKLAMIRADALLRERRLSKKVQLLVSIHDELLYEVDGSAMEEATVLLRQVMENVTPDWPVALKVKVATGLNWADLNV